MLHHEGWDVIGVDNDMRRQFFGKQGSTLPVVQELRANLPRYRHLDLDIRDRQGLRELLKAERPSFIVHAAAQPSHDKAAAIPYDDFDVNAGGTLNLAGGRAGLLPESPFCFLSTNKVYGDRPNQLALIETPTRWDYADAVDGVSEDMSIDQCLHSLFGASKVAADVLCQEYGRTLTCRSASFAAAV